MTGENFTSVGSVQEKISDGVQTPKYFHLDRGRELHSGSLFPTITADIVFCRLVLEEIGTTFLSIPMLTNRIDYVILVNNLLRLLC